MAYDERMYGAGTFFDRTLIDIYAMVLNYDLGNIIDYSVAREYLRYVSFDLGII